MSSFFRVMPSPPRGSASHDVNKLPAALAQLRNVLALVRLPDLGIPLLVLIIMGMLVVQAALREQAQHHSPALEVQHLVGAFAPTQQDRARRQIERRWGGGRGQGLKHGPDCARGRAARY